MTLSPALYYIKLKPGFQYDISRDKREARQFARVLDKTVWKGACKSLPVVSKLYTEDC